MKSGLRTTRHSYRRRLRDLRGCGDPEQVPPLEPAPRQLFARCPRCERSLVGFVYLDDCPGCGLNLNRIREALIS
jgi:uncharacterized protein (DUF983 family)